LPRTAGVLAVVLTEGDPERAARVGESLRSRVAGRGRPFRLVIEPFPHESRGERLHRALQAAEWPIVLITTATEPWTDAHLKPLIDGLDRSDHVIGRRRRSWLRRLGRSLATLPWRLLFAVPITDVHSPCRAHRREALQAIPPQSTSRFLDVETLAKASFLAQLVSDPEVPPLPAAAGPRGFWGDFLDVFRRPVIRFEPEPKPEPATDDLAEQPVSDKTSYSDIQAESAPLEDPQGEQERCDGPSAQDEQVG